MRTKEEMRFMLSSKSCVSSAEMKMVMLGGECDNVRDVILSIKSPERDARDKNKAQIRAKNCDKNQSNQLLLSRSVFISTRSSVTNNSSACLIIFSLALSRCNLENSQNRMRNETRSIMESVMSKLKSFTFLSVKLSYFINICK